MPNTHSTLTSLFTDIADAIRSKTGGSESILADAFPTAIEGIPTGITPSGVYEISANGTYDITSYASASVNVSGGGGNDDAYKIAKGNYCGKIEYSGYYLRPYAYASNPMITEISAPNLMILSNQALNGTNITSMYLPNVMCLNPYWLTSGMQYPGISSLCSKLAIAHGQVFAYNVISGSLEFDRLATTGQSMFFNSPSITAVSIPMVATLQNYVFSSIASLSEITFGAYSTPYGLNANVFRNLPNLSAIYVPSNALEAYAAAMGSWSAKLVAKPEDTTYSRIYPFQFMNTSLSEVPAEYNNCVTLGPNAFASINSFTTLSLSQCTHVLDMACYSDSHLTTVDLPMCSYIGKQAFEKCSNITSININNVEYLSSNAFYLAKSADFGELNLSKLKFIGFGAFGNCWSMSKISLPLWDVCDISQEMSQFYNCINLSEVDVPNLTIAPMQAFYACSSLVSISCPNVLWVLPEAFQQCIELPSINLPKCNSIGTQAFKYDAKLSEIYIGTANSSVCQLVATNAFDNCSALQSIYVPMSLVDAYKSATNWILYSDKIVGV